MELDVLGESERVTLRRSSWDPGEQWGPDVFLYVCMCFHVSVSLLVFPCVPTPSLVQNSWLPPSAATLHQEPQNIYVLHVCVSP